MKLNLYKMEKILGYAGTSVITFRAIYWLTLFSQITLIVASIIAAFVLPKQANVCQSEVAWVSSVTIWVLATNLTGFISAFVFFYTAKGTAPSIIGCFVWLLNII